MSLNSQPLIELKDVVGDSFSELIDQLLIELGHDIQTLEEAVGQRVSMQNFQQVAEQAHKLKGALGSLGATKLTEGFGEIEKLAKEGKIDSCNQLYHEVLPDLKQVCKSVRVLCNKI